MIRFRNIYFPDNETYFQEHITKATDVEVAGAATYQWGKFAHCIPIIRDFRHAVDVGANVGLWARVMGALFTKVTCFEPVVGLADCLALNAPGVDIHRCALGDKEGSLTLRVIDGACGLTHPRPTSLEKTEADDRHNGLLHGKMEFSSLEVPVRTLDSFDLPKIDFLKIDVEGFEYFVVKGGVRTIRRDHPVIIVEQKSGTAEHYGLQKKEAVDFLGKMGAKVKFDFAGDYCLSWE